MVKQRKSSKQRQSRRQSRKQRQSQRQSRHRRSQRGGAAPFDASYEALTGAARAAAQVAPLDRYISDLPGLIPRQGGGYMFFDNSGNNTGSQNGSESNLSGPMVGGSAPFGDPYTYKLNGGRRRKNKRSRRNSRSRRQRNQRGGNAPFDAPYSFGYKLPGVNEQFASEGSVNSLYSQNRGAQGY